MKALLLICLFSLTTAFASDCGEDPPTPPSGEKAKAPAKPAPTPTVPPQK